MYEEEKSFKKILSTLSFKNERERRKIDVLVIVINSE